MMKRRGGAAGGGGGGGRQLAETLKQELNCAVSQVVDTVVKGFSSPKQAASHHHGCHSSTPAAPSSSSNSSSSCPPPFGPLPSLTPDSRFGGGALALSLNGDGSPTPNYHSSNQRLHCFGDVIVPSPLDSFGSLSGRLSGVPTPNDQTEALPLVVRKSGGGGGGENTNPSLPPPPPPHHPSLHPSPLTASLGFSPPSFRHPIPSSPYGLPLSQPFGVTRGWRRLPSRAKGAPSVLPRFHGHDPGNCQPQNQNGQPRRRSSQSPPPPPPPQAELPEPTRARGSVAVPHQV